MESCDLVKDVSGQMSTIFRMAGQYADSGVSIDRVEKFLHGFSPYYGRYLSTVEYTCGNNVGSGDVILDDISCRRILGAGALAISDACALKVECSKERPIDIGNEGVSVDNCRDGVETNGRVVESGSVLNGSARDSRTVDAADGDDQVQQFPNGVSVGGYSDQNGIKHTTKLERNRANRSIAKDRKKKRQAMSRDWRDRGVVHDRKSVVDDDLRTSLKDKWKAENALAMERARRALEVLKASDLEQEVKRYRTNVSAATERNMVSIEKTHALLRASGNIPGDFHGSVETVVDGDVPGLSGGSGSITPDSSASMAEFRACQKNLLDAENKIEKMVEALKRFGLSEDALMQIDKRTWTDNTHNDDVLDQIYPNGHGGYPVERDGVVKISLVAPDY